MTQDGAGCKNGKHVDKQTPRSGSRRRLKGDGNRAAFQGAGLMPTLMALAELKYFFASALTSLSVIDR
jgi:hypothetical protein